MAIPKYNELYRPFLNAVSDGEVHKLNEIITDQLPLKYLRNLRYSKTVTIQYATHSALRLVCN